MFLLGDAVGCAMADQKVPDGYYHLDRMIFAVARHGGEVGCCGTCMDARGHHRGDADEGIATLFARGAGGLDAVGRSGRDLLTSVISAIMAVDGPSIARSVRVVVTVVVLAERQRHEA